MLKSVLLFFAKVRLDIFPPHILSFQLQIWDTAGQERFRSITQSYYRSANALILTYDITCEDSFRCLPEWLREIEQYANNQVVTILVGKKASRSTYRRELPSFSAVHQVF